MCVYFFFPFFFYYYFLLTLCSCTPTPTPTPTLYLDRCIYFIPIGFRRFGKINYIPNIYLYIFYFYFFIVLSFLHDTLNQILYFCLFMFTKTIWRIPMLMNFVFCFPNQSSNAYHGSRAIFRELICQAIARGRHLNCIGNIWGFRLWILLQLYIFTKKVDDLLFA